MKYISKISQLLFCVIICIGCSDYNNLEPSKGDTNQLTIVIEDALWNGEVGDSLRKKLAVTVKGLPQEEPLFNLVQRSNNNGDAVYCKNRNVFIVERSEENTFQVTQDDFAQNQNVIYLSAESINDIICLFEEKCDTIIKVIKNFEIKETQKKIALSLLDDNKIKQKFGVMLDVPSDYRKVLEDSLFVWYKKDQQHGSYNLIVYQTPYYNDNGSAEIISRIVQERDMIGNRYIHSEDNNVKDHMITEESYTPYFFTESLSKKQTYITKGTWEFEKIFMSGPFINYTFYDKENNRNVVVEGFAYAPSAPKRDMMHELEAIIRSIKFM